MIALQRTARVICTVVVQAAAVLALVVIGRRPGLTIPVRRLGPWLRDGDPATVVVALLRWVALVGATWLLVSTLLYVVASVSRVPTAVRAVRWSTVPAVRRAVDAACAVSVVTSVVLAPTVLGEAVAGAARADDPPVVTLVRDGRGIAQLPPDTTSTTPATTSAPPTSPAIAATVPSLPSTPSASLAASLAAPVVAPDEVVVVVEGDNLWTIAAARLAQTSGRSPADVPDAEIAPYWARVCDANRSHLASGDPNLIVPGEHVVLPIN
jgi:hypothetical protein